MRARALALAAFALFGAGCAGCGAREALESLRSDAFSPKYHSGFWAEEASKQTALWKEALQLCGAQETRAKPNCRVVLAVDLTVQLIAIRQDEDLGERLKAWIRGGTRALGLPGSGSMPPATKGFGPDAPRMPAPAAK
jgi:hypothetical protein